MFPAPRSSFFFPARSFQPANRLEVFFEGPERTQRSVPVSVWADPDHVYVEADLPGVAESDLELTVHEGTLLLRGERKPVEANPFLYNERSYGRWERAIVLPEEVTTDGVVATLSQGVLRVTLPKRPERKPKQISVQSR